MLNSARFSADPASCFQDDISRLHDLPVASLASAQLYAINERFLRLRQTIGPLATLADAAKIQEVGSFEDAGRLLFPHSIYKSYNVKWLDDGDYGELTQWIGRLTSVDLTTVKDKSFATLDQWFDTLKQDAGLTVAHSSGTTGRLTFFARSTAELENTARYARMTIPDWTGLALDRKRPAEFSVLWTTFAQGRSAVAIGSYAFRHGYAASPDDFHAMIPGQLSADWHYFMLRVNRAEAQGQPPPIASAYVGERIDEMNALHAQSAEQMEALLGRITGELKGKRILFAGAPFVLHDIAKAGVARGMKAAFTKNSAVLAFGGLKGRTAVDGMAGTILRFAGASAISNLYVMTEASAALNGCEYGRFHLVPWLVPFLLDPVTGQLLPREGARRGRAAFFDLLAETYWGGIVTADWITLDWTPCPCGRQSAHIHPDIGRFEDGETDMAPPCPAANEAVREAMMQMRD
jgi:hypothetical protein